MASEGASTTYSLDLKENLVRRAIALTIDHAVLSVITVLIGGFFVVGVFFGNPIAIFFGLPAGFFLKSSNSMGAEPNPLVYMISAVVIYFILSLLYFSFFDSNGRRTVGKSFMHLETLTEEGFFPGSLASLKRSLIKSISGALGIYFLGLLGAGIAMGIACYVDLRSAPGKKGDLRQRRSEVWARSVVLLEDEETPFGTVSGYSGDWKKVREEKDKKAVKLPSFGRKEKGPAGEKRKMRLFSKKEKGPDEPEKSPVKLEAGTIPEKEATVQPQAREGALETTTEQTARSKELEKEEAVLRLMMDLDIDENRARGLTDAGYRKKEDLLEAIPQDLLAVKGINPTLAKRIIERAKVPSQV